jgi:hypothetical protein
MISILFIGVMTALAVFAILAKTCLNKPKKAGKAERSEILKQLLALSDGESAVSATASPPIRSIRPAATSVTGSETLRKGTYRQDNFRQRQSHTSSNPPVSLRPNQTGAEIEEQIRQRAHELYRQRGGMDGNATEDWLQAKQEVLSHKPKAGTTSS